MSKKKETIPNDIPEDIRELRVISDDNKLLGTENLSEPQNSRKMNEMVYEVSQSMEFNVDEFDNISEQNPQEQSSTQSQIQIPPK
nr:12611_t:CDS:2 [Entrophospora candida]